MSLVDDRVLEFIQENGHGSPTEMMNKGPIPYSRAYIARRCKKLVEHGLLQHVGNGVYTITERGEGYLKGEVNTSEDAPDNADGVEDDENGDGESESAEG